MIGKTFAHYEITAHIGSGGMGDVYKARDTKLDRDVALKFLPETFAADAERLQRFEREAKLLAALNHPNIAAIYGTEHDGGSRFLVLELVPGADLSERIGHGPLPVDDALAMSLQVTEALEAAHDQGVVHRDLKPGNIVVNPDGKVKVLDFGLAKALETDRDNSGLSHSPTMLASSPTVQGVILGTAGYMSPEQARGKVVDRRADIWAFGCVLLEMLTGRQTFAGETVSDALASVLKTDPEWDGLPADTPPAIERLLRRCLDKDPRQRLRDIGEARIILERVIRGEVEETAAVEHVQATSSGRGRIAWLAASVVVAAVVGTTAWTLKPESPEAPLRKFSLAVERTEEGGPDDPAISPDGRVIAYTVGGSLFVQELDELKPRELEVEGDADMLFWAPDGEHIGYLSQGKLWKVPVSGGSSVKICDPKENFAGGRGAVWGSDGRIIFTQANDKGMWVVSDQGGDPREFFALDAEKAGDYHEPSLLPGDKGIIYVVHRKDGSPDTIALLADGETKTLVQVEGQRLWYPKYSKSGYIVYRRSGSNKGVWAVPFSLSKLDVTGEPFLVAADGADPSVALDETLVYLRGEGDRAHVMRFVGRDGSEGDSVGIPVLEYAEPAFSPDGRLLAVSEYDGEEVDIWVHDITRGTKTRFTFEDGEQMQPAWSADGKYIYYSNAPSDSIFVRAADGTGAARAVVEGVSPVVSRDGRYLAYHTFETNTSADIWYLELKDDAQPQQLVATQAREGAVSISPDGRYFSYQSDESGSDEIYVKRFPSGEGKWQVSNDGGLWPQWSRDGTKVYYRHGACDIVEVPVETESGLVLGVPRKIVDCSDLKLTSLAYRCYAESPDGLQILMLQSVTQDYSNIDVGITVVENWAAEFVSKNR